VARSSRRCAVVELSSATPREADMANTTSDSTPANRMALWMTVPVCVMRSVQLREKRSCMSLVAAVANHSQR